MNLFWFWALLLSILASLFVLLPLFLPRRPFSESKVSEGRVSEGSVSEAASREGVNVALYVEHLAELEAAQARGDITPQEYAQLEIEMQENLLLDTAPASTISSTSPSKTDVETVSGATSTRRGFMTLVLAALLVPLVAVFIFADFGLGRGAVSDVVLLEEMLEKSSQKKTADPHQTTEYRQLVEQLAARISTQPDNVEGQFLLARSWSRLQEPAKAAAIYEQLRRRFPQDLTLATHYAEALFAADAQQMTARVTAAIVSAQQLASATGRSIMVLVEVAANVTVPEDAVVFVYARAWEGPSVPLAVRRLTRADLPKLVRLDESMAMMQGTGLREYDKVQLVARISATGSVVVSDDDYEARSPVIDLSKDNAVIKLLVEHKSRPTSP